MVPIVVSLYHNNYMTNITYRYNKKVTAATTNEVITAVTIIYRYYHLCANFQNLCHTFHGTIQSTSPG